TLQHKKAQTAKEAQLELIQTEQDLAAYETEKIKGAVRTDFILSAEIVVISLGTVAAAGFLTKVTVLSLIAIAMTVGVYGFVALIVKIDDIGLYLTEQAANFKQRIGHGLLAFAPVLMKTLSVVGTAAMFLVGGGIINHAIPFVHHFTEDTVEYVQDIPTMGSIVGSVTPMLMNLVVGILAGILVVIVVALVQKVWSKSKSA
ncbi:MAG: DUF808 family protein, partial [Acinetobacter towneri]|nr:DUF808 family protein [Acinetobacter towneri]